MTFLVAWNGIILATAPQGRPSGALEGATGPSFQFNQAQYQVREGEALRITVENIGSGPGCVDYATRDGTAIAGEDYLARSGTLELAAWETSASLPLIYTGNDFIFRGDRTFTIHLSACADGGQTTDQNVATVTILDDDQLDSPDSCLETRLPEPWMPPTNAALQVILQPPEAGGQWRLPGELSWRSSGELATGLAPANYLVEFRSWPGYWPLNPQRFPTAAGWTNRIYQEFFLLPETGRGHLTVRLAPDSVVLPGDPSLRGAWRLPGETGWHESGDTVGQLPAGVYYLEFRHLPNYLAPLDPKVTVFAGQTAVVTKTYFVAQAGTGRVPEPLSFEQVVSTNWPYLHNGQVVSEFGFGSGVVVKERVVLTAAHVLFDEVNLGYAREVQWLHQKQRGAYEPAPQTPRGWYVFEDYAALREIENTPGMQSLEAASLDVAAMYFVANPAGPNLPGRGGYAGYLASNAEALNEHLTSGNLMMLVGYPVAGLPIEQVGKMHASPLARLDFRHLQDHLFTTDDIQAFPGMSGGALYVYDTVGRYYPAAIYISSTFSPVVRAIDADCIDLISRAERSASDSSDNSELGVILIIPDSISGAVAEGSLSIIVSPSIAEEAGAGWRIPEKGMLNYTNNSEFRVPLVAGESFHIEFREVSGYVLPTNDIVEVAVDQLSVLHAFYRVTPPVLSYDPRHGLGIAGTDRTSYRIEYADRLGGHDNWVPVAAVTLRDGSNSLSTAISSNGFQGYYRAVWIPEP